MNQQIFSLSSENPYINSIYQTPNYKVIPGLADNDICVIFFSGNALYYPNTVDSFRRTIIYKDRYEWASVASKMIEYVSKIILVRDVKKSWYVDGINQECNSIDKVVKLLEPEIKGYRLFVYGNSAGGYMAMLAGTMLHAERIYNWGGQTDLYLKEETVHSTEFIDRANNILGKNKYFSIKEYIQNTDSTIFSFYSGKNTSDAASANIIGNLPSVYTFLYDSDQHGKGFEREVYINLLFVNQEKLIELNDKYKENLVLPETLGLEIINISSCNYKEEKKKDSLYLVIRHKLGNIKRKIFEKN